jgi:hypothetical protein
MPDFFPLPIESRPYERVMFINAVAPVEQLREAALQRLAAVEDLLCLLEDNGDHATARLASALAPLVSEARQLCELALDRPVQKGGRVRR